MTARAEAPSISEARVRELAEALREPSWLLQRRLDALRAYEAMAMPDPLEEEWRRTDISGLDLEAALAAQGEPSATLQGTDLPAGVVFGEISALAAGHEGLLRQLHSLARPTDWKLAALQAALRQPGAFLYVPRGVEVEAPLVYRVVGAGAPVFPHLIVVAEENSSVTVIQDVSSRRPESGPASALPEPVEGQSLVSGAVEIFCRPDARVRFLETQEWGTDVYNFSTIRAHLDRGARLTAALVGLGARLTKTKLEAVLQGEGASAELLGLSFGDGRQHFDYGTLQDHIGARTSSDLLFKTALEDNASDVWTGTVRIRKGASLSEANQTSRNLLLSDHAKAAPIPVLEIEAYDVLRCSHGASAGPLDEEQRFYLESRGIPKAEAERLLVEAFFQPVLDRMPVESVRERIERSLAAKIEAGF